jgi:dipeptidase E
MIQAIIASSSTVHDSDYLDYLLDDIALLFKHTETILFVPYARPSGISHEAYTNIVREAFSKINKTVIGLHTFKTPAEALKTAKGIFVGGGNTFVLTHQLYDLQLMAPLRHAILDGIPYLGTSAGSNICGPSIKTTNDMPIVYPTSLKALGILPFNINAHYLDPDANSKHMGETRETRLKEFHEYNTTPVVGLREGSWLSLTGTAILLKGTLSARLFKPQQTPYEIAPNTLVQS